MKQFTKYSLFSMALLAGMAAFTACSSDEVAVEDTAPVNPTYNGETVKTEFAINIPHANTNKRMTESNAQGGDNPTFLGMEGINLIPLATFNAERLAMLPDVPTLRELGYDFDQTSWRLLVVNKDTPDAVVKILTEATKKAMESPEMKKSAEENYEILAYLPPEEADAFLQKEFDYYRDLALSMGLHYSQKKK